MVEKVKRLLSKIIKREIIGYGRQKDLTKGRERVKRRGGKKEKLYYLLSKKKKQNNLSRIE